LRSKCLALGLLAPRGRVREFFKKPWWVGPLAAAVAFMHPHAEKPELTTGSIRTSEQRVTAFGTMPRYGSVVVVAACASGQRLSGGGYKLPSALSRAASSKAEGTNAWRVEFKSLGGAGKAMVYATCIAAK
jgi:hypothetical protein